MTAKQII